MSFYSPPPQVPEFTGLQVQTAVNALPIPIIYGAPRCSTNIIYVNGFYSKKASSGGKGLSGKSTGQIEYFATVLTALGEGEIGLIVEIYHDRDVYTPANFPSNGAEYFGGSDSQSPCDYVLSQWPQDARTYKDTAYFALNNYQLDSSATMPQLSFVPIAILSGTCALNRAVNTDGTYNGDPDADPAQVIYDFLTNSRYGAGFPSSLIDTSTLYSSANATNMSVGDSALQTYCQAMGFGWSICLNNPESASSILDRWTKNMLVAVVWTGELLKFIPYYDGAMTLNPGYDASNLAGPGATTIGTKRFSPNVTVLATFDFDHIQQSKGKSGDDPLTFERTDPYEVYNTVRLTFKDRANLFNDNVFEAKDEAHASVYGTRVDNLGTADEFALADYANHGATLRMRYNVSVRRRYTFRLSMLWAFFDPMDVIQIPDPTHPSVFLTVRIISMEDDEHEITTYTCEELMS